MKLQLDSSVLKPRKRPPRSAKSQVRVAFTQSIGQPSIDINSAEQIVISGDAIAVTRYIVVSLSLSLSLTRTLLRAGELSKKHGVRRVIPLEVSAPFHCQLMAPAAAALAQALASIELQAPRIPVLSNVTGHEHGSVEEIRASLVRQVTAPVRWSACVARARQLGCDGLLEFGPGEVLSALARKLKPQPLDAMYDVVGLFKGEILSLSPIVLGVLPAVTQSHFDRQRREESFRLGCKKP